MTTPPLVPLSNRQSRAQRRGFIITIVVLALLLVQILFNTPSKAGLPDPVPKMYWITDSVNNIMGIQRANLDGSNVEEVVMAGLLGPAGIALDTANSKIYLTIAGKIQRAGLDGTSREDVVTTDIQFPNKIALDTTNGEMYWTDSGTDKIQRANLDGSNVEDLVTTGLEGPEGIALDTENGKIYWADWISSKIQRANLDGTGVEDLVTIGLRYPQGVALDTVHGKIYWTDSGTDKIQRANLDGNNVEDLVTNGLTSPIGIALDTENGKMYWTVYTDGGTGKIQRANLDGSAIEDLVTSDLTDPLDIALLLPLGATPTARPTDTSIPSTDTPTPQLTESATPQLTGESTLTPDTPIPDTPIPDTPIPDTPIPDTPIPPSTEPPTGVGQVEVRAFLPLFARSESPPTPPTPPSPPTPTTPTWQRFGNGTLRTITSLAVRYAQLYAGDRGSEDASETKGFYATSLLNCDSAQAVSRIPAISSEVLDLAMTDTVGLVAGFSDGIYYLDNNDEWQQSLTGVGAVQSVAIADEIGYAGVEENIYQSTTSGATWDLLTTIPLIPELQIGDVPPNSVNEIVRVGDLLWIGTEGQGVYFWSIADGTLEGRSNGLNGPGSLVVWDILHHSTSQLDEFYLATQDGVYTGQGLTSWRRFGQGLEQKSIRSLAQTETTLYAGTVGSGIYQIEFANPSTWVPVTVEGAPTSPTWTVRDLLYDGTHCNGLLAATQEGVWLLSER